MWTAYDGAVITSKTGQEISGNKDFYGLYASSASATGEKTDVSVSVTAHTPKDGSSQDTQVFALEVTNGSNITLGGAGLELSLDVDLIGSGNNQAAAFDVYGAQATVSADKTNLSVESTRSDGKSVYGIGVGGSGAALALTGSEVNINVRSATQRATANNYSEIVGIDAYGGSISSSGNTTLNIIGKTTGEAATQTSSSAGNFTGTTPLYGIKFEGGQGDLRGQVNIDVSSAGGLVEGVGLINYFFNTSMGENYGDSSAKFSSLSIKSSSRTGDAYGIRGSYVAKDGEKYNVIMQASGDVTVAASSAEGNAYGIHLAGTSNVRIDGNATVSASAAEDKDAYAVHVTGSTLELAGQDVQLTGDVYLGEGGALSITREKGSTTITGDVSGTGSLDTASNLAINGSLDDFSGDLTLNTGSTFTLTSALKQASLIVNGGTLSGQSSVLFTGGTGMKLIADDVAEVKVGTDTVSLNRITSKSGAITVTDEGVYTADSLSAMSDALADGSASLVFLNAALAEGQDAVLTDNVVQATEEVTAEVSAGTAGTPATLTVKNSGAQSLVVSAENDEPVAAVKVVGNEATTLTLVGAAERIELVKNSLGEAVDLTIGKNVGVQLGLDEEGVEETKGHLSTVRVESGSSMKVNNIRADLDALILEENNATVTVGSERNRGALSVGKLNLARNSTIFLDPAWSGDATLDVVAKATHFEVSEVETLLGNLVAGRNSLAVIGASADDAVAAFSRLAAEHGVAWGEGDITSALYVADTVYTGSTGRVVVDGSLTALSEFSTNNYAQGVTVADNGMLMLDQAALGGKAAVNGMLTMENGSFIALVNSDAGTVQLTESAVQWQPRNTDEITVITDNPFVNAVLGEGAQAGSVVASYDAENGLKAISSLGLQAMTRRADSVLAGSIADRTSFGQDLKPGVNLWVDAGGETYKADDFDKGGKFEADMGYGTFGGDVAVGNFTVGGAFQYGSGTLRSSVSNIKNSIDNYGFSLYGTYSVTDVFKLGAELAYVWSENDVTSSQTALNQSVDTQMFSLGVRAMYEMTAGSFRFVPSIGVRVSQLSTDEMKIGRIKVDDQDQTLVQIPIAMRVTVADFAAKSGWTFSPILKVTFVPTFGDKDIEAMHSSEDVIDTTPVQADFGLLAGKDNMLVNVNLMLGAGEYGTTSVGGKIGLKYAF